MTASLLLYVFLGGGIGSVVRYALGHFLKQVISFPLATLLANVLAALLIGALAASSIRQQPAAWSLLAIGFCGGLSTFSTFSFENVQLLQQGQWAWAALNIVLSIALSLTSTWLAMRWVA